MVKILSGDYVLGEGSLKAPPSRDPKNPHIRYDSVVDNQSQPNIWVIFNDHQMYAQYVIVLTD